MKKYYFIVFTCDRTHWPEAGGNSTSSWTAQDVIDVHPIQYQINFNRDYAKYEDIGGYSREECTVTFYHELTKVEYDQFNGEIG